MNAATEDPARVAKALNSPQKAALQVMEEFHEIRSTYEPARVLMDRGLIVFGKPVRGSGSAVRVTVTDLGRAVLEHIQGRSA